jgi:myo-inositol-1(or 4)-monophosphatase
VQNKASKPKGQSIENRQEKALCMAKDAGALALEGPQDFVSEADKAVEEFIRDAIARDFPGDGIVGEEHAPKASQSGYTWVIDPIDGTANFINAIPAWTVVIALVKDGETQVGVIHDPVHGEMFSAVRGGGAMLNDAALLCPADTALSRGSVGTGFSNRAGTDGIRALLNALFDAGGMYHRNGSGALSLAYVAAGRLLGYMEENMNAWDCIAGQLIISEAGGRVEVQDADAIIANGGRVVAASAGVFDELVALADASFKS